MDNYFLVYNYITSETVIAFKEKKAEYNTLKDVLYYGEKTLDSPRISECKIMEYLLSKEPELFNNYEEEKSRVLLNIVRDYTEFFLPYFISTEVLEEYLIFAEEVINEGRKFNINLLLGDMFPNVSDFVSKLPFVIISDVQGKEKANLLIATQEKIDELKGSTPDYILALGCKANKLEVGPLVNVTKFEIPHFRESLYEETKVMHHEELLVCFFLERILFIQLFNLYNKMRHNEFFPTRNKVCINRMDLQGYNEPVTLYPKYLTGQVV